MRYIHKNDDDSVAIWTSIPYKAIGENGKEYKLHTLRRKNGRTELVGGDDKRGLILDLGDETVDVSDLPADHVPGYTLVFPTFDEIKAKLAPAQRDKVVGHRAIQRNELIEDRTFRGAWKDNGQLHVDMPKAREIQRDRIRKVRETLLETLDTAYMRADEQNDNPKKAQIAQEKQRLRDFTTNPAIDAAQTPEELKAVLPTIEITL